MLHEGVPFCQCHEERESMKFLKAVAPRMWYYVAPLCIVVMTVVAVHAQAFAEKPLPRPDKIKFKNEAGKTAFSLKLKDDGGKLVDGQEKELARYTRSENKIKIKDEADKVLGYVVMTADKIRLEMADQKTVLFTLRHQADGDWKLEDPGDIRVYTVKKRDYGVEIEDAAKSSLYKVKTKGGKSSLRNASDKTVFHTDEEISAAAMACLGFDKIPDVRLRGALLFALDHGPKK